jgi:nicotine blue oxidoreductase
MGEPKPLLRFGDATALDLAVAALAEGGCDPVVAVLGARAEELLDRVAPPARAVVHPGWESGRSGSLLAGLRATRDAPAWIVLPVDHPLVLPADVRALASAWRASRPPVVRVVRDGRGGHPVLLDAALAEEVLALGDDAPLRDVVRAHRAEEVVVEGSPGVRVDVNTPEDYAAALEAYRRLSPPSAP